MMTMTPKTNYSLDLEPLSNFENRRKDKRFFKNIIWGNSQISRPNVLENRVLGNPEDPSYNFLKIFKMGSISFKNHEIDILE